MCDGGTEQFFKVSKMFLSWKNDASSFMLVFKNKQTP